MKRSTAIMVVALSLALGVPARNVSAQKSVASMLEAKVRQGWDDWQNKNEKGYASILAPDATAVEVDGRGIRDVKTELADMHAMDMTSHSLSDFKFRSLGSNAELVTYNAVADVKLQGQSMHAGLACVEVWVKRNGAWKLLHYQETETK